MLTLDTMFSHIMGRPAYQLKIPPAPQVEALAPLHESPVFAYAKVAVDNLPALHFLAANGFTLVDTSVTFDKAFRRGERFISQADLRFAQPTDADATIRVARESFIYSRFHQDPQIEQAIADEIKAVWASNYFKGERGQAMVLAVIDGQVAGFLQLLYKTHTLVIDLIAVHPNYRRQGIARDLIRYAQTHCPPHENLLVTTQLVNIPSMRLYEDMGFRIADAQHIFHYHG